MILFFKKLLCSIFGHKHYMFFNKKGIYWCHASGAYDNVCRRCYFRWENTARGKRALKVSQKYDPRLHNRNPI